MFRYVGLDGRDGPGGTESGGQRGWWYSLGAGLSPAHWLVGTVPEQWSSSSLEQGPSAFLCFLKNIFKFLSHALI